MSYRLVGGHGASIHGRQGTYALRVALLQYVVELV